MALMMVTLVSIWILFAPEPFGGLASYVIVAGASMEPGMHFGDLVIIHKAQVYEVGDVVTYQHPVAGPIIHRIIDRVGDQYVFQGDNNDWVDSYQPTQEEFIGKLWLHIPKVGQYLTKIRSPLFLSIFSILIAIGIFRNFSREKEGDAARSIRKRSSPSSHKRPSPTKSVSNPFKYGVEGIIFLLASMAFICALLALVCFTRPITITENKEISYQFRGSFEYSADAPSGIYNTEYVKTGDPIYFQLTDEMVVNFDFQLIAENFSDVSGMVRLDAELSDPGGWIRTIELHPIVSFNDTGEQISGEINLKELRSLTMLLEERTGFVRSGYTLEIVPSVTIKAMFNGNEVLDSFEPRLNFRIEEYQMYPVSTEAGVPRLEQLQPQQIGYLGYVEEVMNKITVLGISIPVITGRWISVIGLVLSIAGLLVYVLLYVRTMKEGEQARILMKYGPMLIDIQEGNFVEGHHQIEVSSIEDLGRFAERVNGVILHKAQGDIHHYYVQEADITYHYQSTVDEQLSQEMMGDEGESAGLSRAGTNDLESKTTQEIQNDTEREKGKW
jgi:signal peptidase I